MNRGRGRFARPRTYSAGKGAYAVAPGDIDRDGRLDLVVAHQTRAHLAVLRGRRGGRFADAERYTGSSAFDVELGDFNGDGHLDAALATGIRENAISIRFGTGDGRFGPVRAVRPACTRSTSRSPI